MKKRTIARLTNALVFVLLCVVEVYIIKGIRINPTVPEFASILVVFFLMAINIKLDTYLFYKFK